MDMHHRPHAFRAGWPLRKRAVVAYHVSFRSITSAFLITYSQGGLTPEEEREAARVAGSARAPALHSEVASHIALTPAAAAMVGRVLLAACWTGIKGAMAPKGHALLSWCAA
jgi:hypothetical protein